MKRLIILLLCCVVLVSMVGCGGNTASPPVEDPPTTVSKTVITEPPAETTPLVTAAELAEKEKEPTPTESKDQETESTVTTTEPIATTQPWEETKPTSTPKSTEPSVAEITESTKETPPKTEEPQEEIFLGIQWSEVDPADIEKLVIEKINAYRIEQGDTAATILPGLTEVARYRANELTTNFEHRGEQHVSTELKYGQYVDLAPYGMSDDSYYKGYSREAIGMGDWFGTVDSMSDRITDGFYHSQKHWAYIGSSEYSYIAVGVTKTSGKWYVCILMSDDNYGG